MYFMFGEPTSVEDISGNYLNAVDIRRIRAAISVMVIDDNPFPYSDLLKEQYQFNIREVRDLDHINSGMPYDLFLCDIDGTGKKIGGNSGGDLIIELRKAYPHKIIIAYTGHAFKADYNKYFSQADEVVEKDIDLQDWVETLDRQCKKLVDPIDQWKKAREYLLKNNVRASLIMRLEHEYAEAYIKKSGIESFKNSSLLKKLSPEAQVVILGVAKTILSKLLTSGS